ncbi:hypothetical protein VNO78_30106 [Psophocarpus tetragonolobus]|uniref:Senescence-associated protein n=1 Tax=Psophocarpus tetragonolobus TaxID=3891 RepID=A0AAN9RWB5_PSOTE
MPARALVRARARAACQGDARPLCHLQYPVAYLSRLQRILPAARWELRFKASHRANPPCEGRQRHVPLGGRGPLLLVGKRTTGARVASSPDSDLEAFSHNPTHGSFAPLAFQPSAMTNCANQRADIEGSKSNVAMNAWLPQASYPCGNFSDTSSFKFRRTKGSIGHAFTVRIRTGNQNQTSFYPFVPHEISVLVELILGHLRYLLTDVPPQPNSPPDNVFRPDRPTEAGLGSRKRGSAPLPIHGIIGLESSSTGSSFPADSAKPVPLAVVSLDSRQGQWESLGFPLSVPVLSRLFDARGRDPEGPVPNPSPDRHATTRSRRWSSSSSPPTADGFGTGTPVPSPQSQSFSRGYGSILPTSLAYIVPSTRGCSPWRPDAVMKKITLSGAPADVSGIPNIAVSCHVPICTDGRSARARALGFAATAAPSYSSGPGPCPNGRVSAQLGTVTQLPVHPASPVLLTKNGPLGALDSVARLNRAAAPRTICTSVSLRASTRVSSGFAPLRHSSPSFGSRQVCSHSNPSQKIGVGRRCTHGGIPPISFLVPYGFTHPLTRTHVRLLGPCFKTGRMGSPQADARSMHVPRHARGRMLPSTIATMTSPRAYQQPGLGPPSQSASVRAPSRSADRLSPFHIRPGHIADPHPLPSRQFQALFDSLFKVLFIFPSRYLFAIGLSPVFSLGRNLPPDWGCIPKQPDSPTAPRGATGSGHNGALTLSGAPFQGTWARSATEDASPDYNSNARGDRFSWWALPGSLAVTKGILRVTPPDLRSRYERLRDIYKMGHGVQNWQMHARNWSRAALIHHIITAHTLPRTQFSTNRDTTITGGQHTPSQHNTPVVLDETFALSHFATFFIDARAEISVAESHFASCVVTTPAGHRLRVPKNRPLQFQFPWHTKRRGLCFIERERGWAVQTMTNPLPTEGEHNARVVPS